MEFLDQILYFGIGTSTCCIYTNLQSMTNFRIIKGIDSYTTEDIAIQKRLKMLHVIRELALDVHFISADSLPIRFQYNRQNNPSHIMVWDQVSRESHCNTVQYKF